MNDSILILTECSSTIGFGHMTRCLSLAHEFSKAGKRSEVWVATDQPETLPDGVTAVDWYDLLDDVRSKLMETYAIVIDSLIVPFGQLERLSQINSRLAIIDDWNHFSYRQGIVIDWTVGAERFAYPFRSPAVRYLLGSRYCAMRPEFSSVPPRDFNGPPVAVLVTFGGSDIRRLTVPILSMLGKKYPDLHKHVVVGAGVEEKGFIETMRNNRTTFYTACDALQMHSLMARSDFAICAGGQTLYELASQGLPAIVIRVIDNQEHDIREFTADGFSTFVGDWNMPDLLEAVGRSIESLCPTDERKRRSAIGRDLVDGLGASRLVRACLECWKE